VQFLNSKLAVLEADLHFVGHFTFELFLENERYIHIHYKVVSLQLSKIGTKRREVLPNFRLVLVIHKLVQEHCWWLYWCIVEFAKIRKAKSSIPLLFLRKHILAGRTQSTISPHLFPVHRLNSSLGFVVSASVSPRIIKRLVEPL
jgi:hypothetical protein